MKRCIIIALDEGNATNRYAITAYLKTKPAWGWWHWFQDLWIVTSIPEYVTPKWLYDELVKEARIGNATILVFAVDGDPSYWGNANSGAWEWLSTIGVAK